MLLLTAAPATPGQRRGEGAFLKFGIQRNLLDWSGKPLADAAAMGVVTIRQRDMRQRLIKRIRPCFACGRYCVSGTTERPSPVPVWRGRSFFGNGPAPSREAGPTYRGRDVGLTISMQNRRDGVAICNRLSFPRAASIFQINPSKSRSEPAGCARASSPRAERSGEHHLRFQTATTSQESQRSHRRERHDDTRPGHRPRHCREADLSDVIKAFAVTFIKRAINSGR
jgi:hypothetical protein